VGAFFRASGTDVVHIDPECPGDVVERVAGLRPSCLLIDLNLGSTNGFDVLEAVAADPRSAGTPAIVVSADARSSSQERAVALGAVGFVPKPFNVKDLFLTVQTVIDGGSVASGPPMVSADALQRRLEAVAITARRTRVPTAFALVHVSGAAPSPVVVAELLARLASGLPGGEVLGATGADEVAVVFPSVGADEAAVALKDALGDGRLDVEVEPGRSLALDVRAGVAGAPAHAGTGDELYMAADVALADARESGGPVAIAR
jgi:CheY-like chemotaxis protein